jgi:hypothetical protein
VAVFYDENYIERENKYRFVMSTESDWGKHQDKVSRTALIVVPPDVRAQRDDLWSGGQGRISNLQHLRTAQGQPDG